ncbi:MAG: hypothetical protein QXL82_02160, partial [Candidatus Aenigmatarchaeota archaeon]
MVKNKDLTDSLFDCAGKDDERYKSLDNEEYIKKIEYVIKKWKSAYTPNEYSLKLVAKEIIEYLKEYTLEDVKKFVELVPILAEKYNLDGIAYADLGFLVTALYKNIIGDNDILVLDVRKWKYKPNYLGYKQERGRVIIIGDVGDVIGKEIKGGEIIIYGNAENFIGSGMEGGKIVIYGNVISEVGLGMK